LIKDYQGIDGDKKTSHSEKGIEFSPFCKKTEKMFFHGINIKRCWCEPHQYKGIGIGQANDPFALGNFEVSVEKMNIQREKIYNEKMINSADSECCFRRFYIKNNQYVGIKKRPQYANE
jgi:hypothetical protein